MLAFIALFVTEWTKISRFMKRFHRNSQELQKAEKSLKGIKVNVNIYRDMNKNFKLENYFEGPEKGVNLEVPDEKSPKLSKADFKLEFQSKKEK